MFDSLDIFQAGMDVLEDRIDQFNQQYVSQGTWGIRGPSYEQVEDGFIDIEAFAQLVHEGYDIVDDATLDLTRMSDSDLT